MGCNPDERSGRSVLGVGNAPTPILPEPWPDPTELVVFAYASGLAVGVSDGQTLQPPLRRGSPARRFAPARGWALRRARKARRARGPAAARRRDRVDARASAAIQEELAGSPGTLSDRVIAYYRHWLGVSGVIAGSLPESQQRFFAAIRGTQ